jgi:lipopolysaccharide/colanic/teichoic acid biosynthesis glycosyltransferase
VTVLAFLITAVIVPMLVSEFTDWLPWLAARLVRAAARTLPPDARERYAEEWLAELDAVPGKLSKLALAVRIFARAPATAAAVGGLPPARGRIAKAALDKITAVIALIVLAPLLAVIALAVKITDRGPVFSRQALIGKDGRPFTIRRFRVLTAEADARLAADPEAVYTPCDPRVTRTGLWLRRLSLDGFPQVLSLLSGDMSLIGPDPLLRGEAARCPEHLHRRFAVRPGFASPWETSEHLRMTWDEAEALNVRYVEHWSLRLELQIIRGRITRGRSPR